MFTMSFGFLYLVETSLLCSSIGFNASIGVMVGITICLFVASHYCWKGVLKLSPEIIEQNHRRRTAEALHLNMRLRQYKDVYGDTWGPLFLAFSR